VIRSFSLIVTFVTLSFGAAHAAGPAFYVATNGSDSNAGTLAAPFATLGKCQTAMQNSSTIKTCYIRAGTYNLTNAGNDRCGLGNGGAAINLGSSDAGETWSFYPPDGYNNAILDGGATIVNWAGGPSPDGLYAFFCVTDATSAITFNGLQFQRFGLTVVYSGGVPIVFTNNVVHDGTTGSEIGGGGSAIEVANSVLTATHNYVYNMQGTAFDVIADTGNYDGMVISYNFIENVCQNLGDCGCIYIANPNTTTASTSATVTYNYCRDVYPTGSGTAGNGNQGVTLPAGQCLYLDEAGSGVTFEYNVCTGLMAWFTMIHGGSNNTISYNILDQGADGGPAITYTQSYPGYAGSTGTGNVFSNNIIIQNNAPNSANLGTYSHVFSGSATPVTVNDNFYYNYSSSNYYYLCNADSGCSPNVGQDATPTTGADPLIHCYGAIISASSAVGNSPTSFDILGIPANWDTPGFWGPPGFTVTRTGTAPSWPTTSGDGVTCTSTN
jgi:hypothetical protein